jgi:2-polyprenyl-3-methyl-5-hydroxy-6-metoxy-1,4-benzoquinol methylase
MATTATDFPTRMVNTCAVCDGQSVRPVFHLGSAPLVPFVREPSTPRESITAPLEIVACTSCGHLFNRAFSADRCKEMYAVDFLTNRPVHPSMNTQLEQIAARLDRKFLLGKRVLEIGAGTGHFSRILATLADSVLLVEPSRALTKDMVPESNINLVNDFFTPGICSEPFDLIVCRQVLEHVADPLQMLSDMHEVLTSAGIIYLEVPRAEFIEERLAVIELHNAHVQYFHRRSFRHLAARAGLEVFEDWDIKNGHDMGFLLRGSAGTGHLIQPNFKVSGELGAALSEKRSSIEKSLRSLKGRGGLYGANWQGTSFFWLYGDSVQTINAVLDDNENYPGYHLFSPGRAIPIRKPGEGAVAELNYLVITAHLHAQAIAERVRASGFTGTLFEAIGLTEV